MYYIKILLVKEKWEGDAERKACHIIANKIEGREMGLLFDDGTCAGGAKVLSKEQVKVDIERHLKNDGIIISDSYDYEKLVEENKHLGIFRANSNEAKALIEKYGHHILDESFFVYIEDDDCKLKHENRKSKCIEENNLRKLNEDDPDYYGPNSYINDDGKVIVFGGASELGSITDRYDSRLISRDYFVVPFSFHY